MKRIINKLVFLIALMAITFQVGCDKIDSEKAFGYSYIFIPQSNVSGGQNLHYLVPTGNDSNTYNFKVDTLNNKINVMLSVSRSGLEQYKSYSVDISTRADTISELIANGKINLTASTIPVLLLPETDYTLPQKVTVPEGKYQTGFYLSIDKIALKAYTGKKVALCVAISNPTLYLLNPVNDKVIVLINVDALKLY